MGTGLFIGWWGREFGASSPKTFLGLCCTKWYTSCFLVGNQRPVHGPSSFLVKNQRQVLGSGACSTLNARCTSLFCSGLCTRRSLVLWTGRLGGTTQDWCGRRKGERGVISLMVPHKAKGSDICNARFPLSQQFTSARPYRVISDASPYLDRYALDVTYDAVRASGRKLLG